MNKNSNGPGNPEDSEPTGVHAAATDAKARLAAGHDEVVADEDTAELPVLTLGAVARHAQADAPSTQSLPEAPASSATSWVKHMESELGRLQARWKSLEAARAESEQAADEKARELDRAISNAAVLEDRLQAVASERDELRHAIEAEKTRALEWRVERDAIAATSEQLRARLQDLETYIEGRKDKWASQNARLDECKATIAALEKSLQDSESRIEARDRQIAALETNVLDLERARSEIEGRHLERDEAYGELQTKLEQQIGESEKLRAESEHQHRDIEAARAAAAEQQAQVDRLTQTVAEQEQTIHALREELGKTESLRDYMEKKAVQDRELINGLQAELAELKAERDSLLGRLERADERMQALETKLDEAEREWAEVRNESAAQQLRITDLEREVAAKSDLIGAFDRNAARLKNLNRSLHAVYDDTLSAEATVEPEPDAPRPPSLLDEDVLFGDDEDHRATVAALERASAADDSILADLDLPVTVPALASRRVFVPLDDQSAGVEYALAKPVMTIGRAKNSDIRVQHLVVSRTHARLRAEAAGTVIEDAGSKNGIAVNSRVVDHAVLRNGDIVSLGGQLDFRYVELEHPAH